MEKTADYWIEKLELQAHPEGGYFKEVYRSEEEIAQAALPDRFPGSRNFSTSIYFLLKGGEPSKFHRILSDELWYFHAGSSAIVHLLNENGHQQLQLGSAIETGENLQVIVPAETYFGAEVNDPNGFILVGCMVAPGFDFSDFELSDRDDLLKQFPAHSEIIERLT
jgi:predicted cupin superfamily sugar epimerase